MIIIPTITNVINTSRSANTVDRFFVACNLVIKLLLFVLIPATVRHLHSVRWLGFIQGRVGRLCWWIFNLDRNLSNILDTFRSARVPEIGTVSAEDRRIDQSDE
jgi:hypothetical protein